MVTYINIDKSMLVNAWQYVPGEILYLFATICIIFSFQTTGTASWCCSSTCFAWELPVLVRCQLVFMVEALGCEYWIQICEIKLLHTNAMCSISDNNCKIKLYKIYTFLSFLHKSISSPYEYIQVN